MRRLTRRATNGGSKPSVTLASFTSAKGTYFVMDARLLGPRRVVYNVYAHYPYNVASFLETEDFDAAFETYCELAIAIKGVGYAEDFARTKQQLLLKSEQLIQKPVDVTLKYEPLFLGDSQYAVC